MSVYLTVVVLDGDVGVHAHPHGLVYRTGLEHDVLWTVLYIVAVIGPSLLSGYPSLVAFGLLNLIGLTVVGLLYAEAFASMWCVWAALSSVLVLVHMVLRRRLPDPHRLHGHPLEPVG